MIEKVDLDTFGSVFGVPREVFLDPKNRDFFPKNRFFDPQIEFWTAVSAEFEFGTPN